MQLKASQQAAPKYTANRPEAIRQVDQVGRTIKCSENIADKIREQGMCQVKICPNPVIDNWIKSSKYVESFSSQTIIKSVLIGKLFHLFTRKLLIAESPKMLTLTEFSILSTSFSNGNRDFFFFFTLDDSLYQNDHLVYLDRISIL